MITAVLVGILVLALTAVPQMVDAAAADRVVTPVVTIVDGSAVRAQLPGCDVDCYIPITCDECEHKAPFIGIDEGSHAEAGGSHTHCVSGQCHAEVQEDCLVKHAMCFPDALSSVSELALAGEFTSMAGAIEYGAGVSLDWDSGLVLFTNCAGRVMGSLLLSHDELTSLALVVEL